MGGKNDSRKIEKKCLFISWDVFGSTLNVKLKKKTTNQTKKKKKRDFTALQRVGYTLANALLEQQWTK